MTVRHEDTPHGPRIVAPLGGAARAEVAIAEIERWLRAVPSGGDPAEPPADRSELGDAYELAELDLTALDGNGLYTAGGGLQEALTAALRRARDARAIVAELLAEVKRLRALINTPRTDEFFEALRIEAAHQVERWGAEHDEELHVREVVWLTRRGPERDGSALCWRYVATDRSVRGSRDGERILRALERVPVAAPPRAELVDDSGNRARRLFQRRRKVAQVQRSEVEQLPDGAPEPVHRGAP